jgi:DinB superfamily
MASGEARDARAGWVSDPGSRAAALAELADFPMRLAVAARTAAGRPVEDGEWTPAQVVRHLVAVERQVHQGRLRDLETQPEARWGWTEPGPWTGEPELDLVGVLARFAAERQATLATLAGLDEAGWERAGTHETFGRLDVDGLVRNAVDHDAEHLGGLTKT